MNAMIYNSKLMKDEEKDSKPKDETPKDVGSIPETPSTKSVPEIPVGD